jgi:alpha-1,2-mannosyltransferase
LSLRRAATAGLACMLGAYGAAVLVVTMSALNLFGGSPESVPLADFGSFYASGQAAGQGLDPYDVYPLTMDAQLGRGTGAAINLNAPFSLPVFQLLTLLDPVDARKGWLVASLVAYALTLGLLMWAYPRFRAALAIAWALAFTALIETITLGQVYAVLALLSTIGWLLLVRQRWLTAAAPIGFVVAFKPNFVIWPALLFVAGYRKAAVAIAAAATLFAVLPTLLYGPRVYDQWLTAVRLEVVNAQVANASLAGWLVRDGFEPSVAVTVGAGLIVLLAVWVWRARPSVGRTSGVALSGLLLGSPLAWVGYSLFLLPTFARSRVTVALILAAALLCIPRLVLHDESNASALVRYSLGAAYSLAWLILLGHEVLGREREKT